ncbi:MAG: hypothetical protein ACKVUT_15855, partial [Gaiella sp.]
MLPIVARPEVAGDFEPLSPALLRSIRTLLPALRQDPLAHSQPLSYDKRIGNLGDGRKIYFDASPSTRPAGYRIVLRLLPNEDSPDRIQIVSIGARANLEVY